MIRSTDIRAALRSRQRGFLLNPFRFGGGGGGGSDPDRASRLLVMHLNGNATDSGPLGMSSTVAGEATSNLQWRTADPKFGSGYAYVSEGGNITISNAQGASALNVGTGVFTVSMWVRPAGAGNEKTIIAKGVNDGNGFLIMLGTGGCIFRSNGTSDLSYSGSISSSVWTYAKFVRHSGGRKIFLNGTEVASDSTAPNITTTAGLEIGNCPSFGASFRYGGEFDELIISALADTSTAVPTSQLADA